VKGGYDVCILRFVDFYWVLYDHDSGGALGSNRELEVEGRKRAVKLLYAYIKNTWRIFYTARDYWVC